MEIGFGAEMNRRSGMLEDLRLGIVRVREAEL
jgi:hypothetical protein